METPLKVLIAEDSEDDTILVADQLELHGYDMDYHRVEIREDMRNAIREHSWNVIISYHTMRHFSSTQALELYKESGLDIPFMVVSGTIAGDSFQDVYKRG